MTVALVRAWNQRRPTFAKLFGQATALPRLRKLSRRLAIPSSAMLVIDKMTLILVDVSLIVYLQNRFVLTNCLKGDSYMPRRKTSGTAASAFHQVQRQARTLLLNLRKDIRLKESALNKLKSEEARLGSLLGRGSGSTKAVSSGPTGRVNWRAVLSALPKQFKAADVRNVRGLKGKRPSEIFAAITRWIDAGAARRKARGVYERV